MMDNSLLEKYKKQEPLKKERTSERAELIKKFLFSINAERKGTKYKPMTAQGVAIKLAHIPTEDLYFCLKSCQQAKSFGWCFFGMLKTKGATLTNKLK